MKALVLKAKDTYPVLTTVETAPVGEAKKVAVAIHAAALNHRDLWIMEGKYAGIQYPIILGSDGVGMVGKREVILLPGSNWGETERFQSKAYQILGLPENGTFAEAVFVEPGQLYDKPAHLNMETAAALPLAGLTAFRVLFSKCQGQRGEKILITGIGGGVALFCLQFAVAAGMEVYVTSSSTEKIEKARKLGAIGGVNYKEPNWAEQLKQSLGGFDVVLDGAGGAGFTDLIKLCSPGARVGVYGGTVGSVPAFSLQPVFWKQVSIFGSTMGSDQDFSNMLDFVNRHKIVPVVDSVFKVEESNLAIDRMRSGEQFGKIVLKMR